MTDRKEGTLGNPAVQQRLRNREKNRELLVNAALKQWMDDPNGRLLFFWLVDDVCNADGGSFVINSRQTAYNEGVRAVGINLRKRVQKVCAREYVLALSEELKRRGEDELQKQLAEELKDAE